MPSVLDMFYILFKTDAKETQSEIEDTTASAEKLADTLDAVGDIDPAGVKAVNDSLGEAGDKAGELHSGVTAVGAAAAGAGVEAGLLGGELGHAGDKAKETAEHTARVAAEAAKAQEEAAKLAAHTAHAKEEAKKLAEHFLEVASGLIGAGAAFASAQILGGIKDSYRELTKLGDEAKRLNLTAEQFSDISEVYHDAGGKADEAAGTFKRLGDIISRSLAKPDGKVAEALDNIGVKVLGTNGKLKDTKTLMLEIAGGLDKLNAADKNATLSKLGVIDPTLRDLLGDGRAKLLGSLNAQRAKGLVSNEDVKNVLALRKAWEELHNELSGFFNAVVGSWAPGLTRFADNVKGLVGWLIANKTLVYGFFIGLGIVAAAAAAVLWNTFIPALTATIIRVAILIAPFLAIIAVVLAFAAAVALAWEDIQAFLHGQPSLIGDLLNKYKWLRDGIHAIGKAFQFIARIGATVWGAITRAAQAAGHTLGRIFGPVAGLIIEWLQLIGRIAGTVFKGIALIASIVWPTISKYAKGFFDIVMSALHFIGGLFATVGAAIWGQWSKMFDGFIDKIKTLIEWFSKLLGFVEDGRAAVDKFLDDAQAERKRGAPAVAAGKGQIAFTGKAAINGHTAAGIKAANTNTKNHTSNVKVDVGKVEVHTQATDADGMAKAAGGALKSELRRTASHYDDGVER